MKINTGIKATDKFINILGSVIGQMSDGIWENTRSMEKYWNSLNYSVDEAGYLVVEDKYYVCAKPLDFFANKIKQIIKTEIEDGNSHLVWSRACDAIPSYMHGTVTVGDCYKLYELLKGRSIDKHTYASFSSYTVQMDYAGVVFDITVDALNPIDAKARALKKFTSNVACVVRK